VVSVIRILIADRHPALRKGLIDIVAGGIEGVIFAEAKSGQEILKKVEHENWDLVSMGLDMPDRSGLDVLRDLTRLRPKLPVVILSAYSEAEYARRALKAGAQGYLSKDISPEELIRAIRKILAGRRYLSPELAQKLAVSSLEEGDQPRHEKLSDREFEILKMLGAGKSVTDIASELHLGVTTVSTHRARILTKMNLKTTAELIHYAMRHHLVN
jgi:two-component system, NarL family, invasion response regulator UvrY